MRIYALWENEKSYVDSLGTAQPERSFMTGRASIGTKATYPLRWSKTIAIAPYVGVYADYYFTKDDAATAALQPKLLRGSSARMISGISSKNASGASFSLAGELGGLGGGDFSVWSISSRVAIPF